MHSQTYTARNKIIHQYSDFNIPKNKLWVDYDQEADVLYFSFERPQKATDSEMLDNGVLLRYKGDNLVVVTILEGSKRS